MIVVGCLVAVAAVLLVLAQARVRRAVSADRALLFERVLDLVEEPVVHRNGVDYPSLTGRVDGYRVTIRPVIDALTLRKLPALWLETTVYRPLPVRASLSVLLRPRGTEFFSPNGGFAHELDPPEGFPRPARVASPDPGGAPVLSVLDPAVGFLHERETKELGLGAGGVRAVRLLAEADQTSYRVSRRAVFDRLRVSPAELTGTLEVLRGIGDRVSTPAARGRS